jgi:hypothetical protein
MTDNTIQGSAMWGAIQQVRGLFANINKTKEDGDDSVIKPADDYESKLPDEKIISLTNNWKREYSSYYGDIKKDQDLCFDYWIGKQESDINDLTAGRKIIVNKLFTAIETFIPIATRANPEPLVSGDNSDEGQALAKDVKDALVYQASVQKLKRKLAKMTRHWLLNLIGAIGIDYDVEIDDIKTEAIHPSKFIFDKDGHINEAGLFTGEYLGEKCKSSAERLTELFPDKKQYLLSLANGKKGTKLEYIKWWWRGTDVFFTLGDNLVLGKYKNPHWNYDGTVEREDPITKAKIKEDVVGINHLPKPIAPYVFLSIFSTGLRPHDDTGLILQNIPQQDQINKRHRQLDKNIDGQNNGIVVDGRVMTKEQAAEAASAKRRGAAIMVNGNPREAVSFDAAPPLAPDVWKGLQKAEIDLDNIFGTSGSTPSGLASEDTARGKIMVSQMDASRIGGGITEYIEQVAETIYNIWVQLMVVHYDSTHYINVLGAQEGSDLVQLVNTRFTKTLTITVKEGSLIPKDPLTQRNEAIDLWSANSIDPLNLYKKLDFPDPNAAAQSLILWQMLQKGQIQPQMYLPSFQIPGQPQQPQQAQSGTLPTEEPGTGGPAVNAPTGQPIENAPQGQPGTQTGAEIQSKQLLQSVPVK